MRSTTAFDCAAESRGETDADFDRIGADGTTRLGDLADEALAGMLDAALLTADDRTRRQKSEDAAEGGMRRLMVVAIAALLLAGEAALPKSPNGPADCLVRYVYFRGILVECPTSGRIGVLNRGLDGRFRGTLACTIDQANCPAPLPVTITEEDGLYVGEDAPLACLADGNRLRCKPKR